MNVIYVSLINALCCCLEFLIFIEAFEVFIHDFAHVGYFPTWIC